MGSFHSFYPDHLAATFGCNRRSEEWSTKQTTGNALTECDWSAVWSTFTKKTHTLQVMHILCIVNKQINKCTNTKVLFLVWFLLGSIVCLPWSAVCLHYSELCLHLYLYLSREVSHKGDCSGKRLHAGLLENLRILKLIFV
jgi:hypothetical protein